MSEVALKAAVIFPLENDSEPATPQPSPELASRLRGMEPIDRVNLLLSFGFQHSALEELQRILSEDPGADKRVACYVKAGQIREQMGNIKAAQACYEEAVALEPRDPRAAYYAFNNLAYCLNRRGRHEDAEALSRRAVAIFPDRFNAHKNLGVALEGLARFPEAAESLLAAARIDPLDPIAVRRLRVLLGTRPSIRRDRPDLAREAEELLARVRGQSSESAPIPGEELEATVRGLLASIEVDEPIVDGDFQVFGLLWPLDDAPEYLLLDDAMAEKVLEVREISEGGSVPRIRVINHAKGDRVFLMAGEQLVGAKQNRVLNASILLDAQADLALPVTCVESGRWSYRGPRFESKGSSSHYALRHMMAKKVHGSYRSRGTPESDQREVWREVSRMLDQVDTDSPSHALDDAYEKRGAELDQATQRLQPRTNWYGAAFCFAGKIVGVDLFDRPATLGKQWNKLARAYALGVLRRKGAPEVSRKQVEDWIRGSAYAVVEVFPSTGLGVDCRVESNRHAGSVLVVDGRPVHLEMFYEEEM